MSTKIRAIDLRLIDDLFEMGGGYVLDFSNRTFAEFFADELGIDIDRPGTMPKERAKRSAFDSFFGPATTPFEYGRFEHCGSTVKRTSDETVYRSGSQTHNKSLTR